MEKIKENQVVSIYKNTVNDYRIYSDHEVGKIALKEDGEKVEVSVRIDPEERKKHYASNGLYLLTSYIHEILGINTIHAVVPICNDSIRHVVEHSGYYIVSRDDTNIYYSHRVFISRKDVLVFPAAPIQSLYLAGGCFWGMEKVFKLLDGVIETSVGYANGTLENPTYEDVIRNDTHYKETVKVLFDSSILSIETLLQAYFLCIHPEQSDGQGEDVGEQYTTGVYFVDASQYPDLSHFFELEKRKHSAFYTELKPLECYYRAEDYHQDYLEKNPNGYCHITPVDLEKVKQLNEEKNNGKN